MVNVFTDLWGNRAKLSLLSELEAIVSAVKACGYPVERFGVGEHITTHQTYGKIYLYDPLVMEGVVEHIQNEDSLFNALIDGHVHGMAQRYQLRLEEDPGYSQGEIISGRLQQAAHSPSLASGCPYVFREEEIRKGPEPILDALRRFHVKGLYSPGSCGRVIAATYLPVTRQ